jgi:hypothetical protein
MKSTMKTTKVKMTKSTKPTAKTVTKQRPSRGQLIPDLAKMDSHKIARLVSAHGVAYDAMRRTLNELAARCATEAAMQEACLNWLNILSVLFASVTYARDRIEVSVTLSSVPVGGKPQGPTTKKNSQSQ